MAQGILLAAGAGRRFGGDKLLARLPDGRPVAVAAAQSLRQGVGRVLAVARPESRELIAALEEAGVEVLCSAASVRGMGASLSAGVAASRAAEGWLVALGDMPWIRSSTAAGLADRLRRDAAITVPAYGGRGGHPVGFSRPYGEALMELDGDRGARDLLEREAHRVERLAVNDPGILRDVDRPADLLFWAPVRDNY